MSTSEPDPWTYVVTDVELDGPWPGVNSMRSFASVAVTANGIEHGRFEAVLEPLPGTSPDARTLEWFATQPEAWAAATGDPEPVVPVMEQYVAWVQGLPWPRMFAAFPLALDGIWMDYCDWFGNVEHTHKAIDDTVGYANLLVELSRRARQQAHRA